MKEEKGFPDGSRAQELEQQLQASKSKEERLRLFRELCRIYAPDLQVKAITWARMRKTSDPVADGPRALSKAFILLADRLPKLDFEKKPLKYRFKGTIWSELGHQKKRRYNRTQRNTPIERHPEPFDGHSSVDRQMVAREELEHLEDFADTPAKKHILRAGMLRAEGYSWVEAAQQVGWKGTPESLRVSFSNLRKSLRRTVGKD